MHHGHGYYGSRRYDPPLLRRERRGSVPAVEAADDCVRVLADERATRDEKDAARAVIRAANIGEPVSPAAVKVLGGYIRRIQEQDRWGR